MERGSLGVVAAMPQEIEPLLQRVRGCRREKVSGFNLCSFTLGGTPVVLVESGMGPAHAGAATNALIGAASPSLIMNVGFAGAVLPGLRVGELVLAERVFRLEKGELFEAPRPDAALTGLIALACRDAGLPARQGSFITACGIMNKGELSTSLGGAFSLPVLEMETAAVLEAAGDAGIPAVALRGISDTAEEELGFGIEELCDCELNLSPWRLLAMLVKKPYLVPQLVRLAGNSRRAGRHLALGVELALRTVGGSRQRP